MIVGWDEKGRVYRGFAQLRRLKTPPFSWFFAQKYASFAVFFLQKRRFLGDLEAQKRIF